jgi:hypothetical protein
LNIIMIFTDATLPDHHFNSFDQSMEDPFASTSSNSSYSCISNASEDSINWTQTSTPVSSPNRQISYGSFMKVEEGFSIADDTIDDFCHPQNFNTTPVIFPQNPNSLVSQGGINYGFGEYFGSTSCSFEGLPDLTMELDTPTSNSYTTSSPRDFVGSCQTLEDSFDAFQSPMRRTRSSPNIVERDETPLLELHDSFDDGTGSFHIYHSPLANKTLSPYSPIGPRLSLQRNRAQPLPSSVALRQIQESFNVEKGAKGKKYRKNGRAEVRRYGLQINTAERGTHRCVWEGCTNSFKRSEHLKRHLDTHRGEKRYPCEICTNPGKIFNRTDNLRVHYKLHDMPETVKNKSSRTRYDPRAAGLLAKMERKTKGR